MELKESKFVELPDSSNLYGAIVAKFKPLAKETKPITSITKPTQIEELEKKEVVTPKKEEKPVEAKAEGIENEARKYKTAKEFVDDYLNELSETLRGEALRDAAEKKRFLEKQLESVIDPFMKEKIHTLRANEVEKETFAKAQKYYGFTVMDPPVVPDRISAEKPKLTRNVVLAMVVAFFLAVFLAFIIEYVRRIKTEDTERYQDLLRELKTWRNSRKKLD